MFVEFFTTNNIRVQVLEVQILLGKMAFVQCYCFLPTGLSLVKLEMQEDEYSQWAADDNYVKNWICSKVPLLGSVAEAYDEFNQPVILDTAIQSDNRSVHNESDLQRISSLEAQIAEQTKLVAQMKNILISKGMI